MHDGFTLWADREPAPTCPMMSNYVRTLYEWLLPPNTSGTFDRELLGKGCDDVRAQVLQGR